MQLTVSSLVNGKFDASQNIEEVMDDMKCMVAAAKSYHRSLQCEEEKIGDPKGIFFNCTMFVGLFSHGCCI